MTSMAVVIPAKGDRSPNAIRWVSHTSGEPCGSNVEFFRPRPERLTTRRGTVDLNLLLVFDALMQERSLTRAGRRLGFSQPATSHALARLRLMLGDELFIRTSKGMLPTQRAGEMAESVRDALSVLRATLEAKAFDPATSDRVFTLAVNNYAAHALVPSLASRMEAEGCSVRLDVVPLASVDVLDQLERGAEVAVTGLVDGGQQFKCGRIMEDDFVVVLDRGHPASLKADFSVEQLARIPHLAVSSAEAETRFVDDSLRQRGLRRVVVARVPLPSIVPMLLGCDRLAVLPRRVANDLTQFCPLAVRDLPFTSPKITLAMIWHRRVDNDPAHRWLRGAIRSSIVARQPEAMAASISLSNPLARRRGAVSKPSVNQA
jgi:DNA-binding transcriptional LysR family regulator